MFFVHLFLLSFSCISFVQILTPVISTYFKSTHWSDFVNIFVCIFLYFHVFLYLYLLNICICISLYFCICIPLYVPCICKSCLLPTLQPLTGPCQYNLVFSCISVFAFPCNLYLYFLVICLCISVFARVVSRPLGHCAATDRTAGVLKLRPATDQRTNRSTTTYKQ